jgi:hypothetical protein
MTFERVSKNVVTAATKVTATVVSEEVEEEEYQEPGIRLDGAPENHLEPILRTTRCQRRGCWALIWAKLLLRIHLFH